MKEFFFIAVLLLGGSIAWAEDESKEGETEGEKSAATVEPAIYLPLKPSFVVNYGSGERLKYLKADVTVRLDNSAAANSVRHHLPFIRNNLVLLFASQTDESISSQEGKEALRAESLKQIQQILQDEEGIEGVVDVYFNRFIVQK